jgi:hypothetical protein
MDKKTGGPGKKGAQPQPAGNAAIWKFTPTMKEKTTMLISAEISGVNVRGGEEAGGTIVIKYVNESLTGTAGGKEAPKTSTPVKKEDL